PAVLGVDRNNVFFLNGKAGIHAIKPPNPFYALSVYLSAAAPPVSCIRDIVFSVLLPVAKKDVVKGKFQFVCLIELCSLALMACVTLTRMTIWKDVAVYRSNAMMNANFFALGMAFVLFGCFNRIFIGGFFRTAYQFGKPFIMNMIVAFVLIGISEVLHHIPSLMAVNAFGFEHFGLQCSLLIFGIILYMLMTTWSYQRSCWNFERTDL
ncbi:MAG: ABC-2 transporter permease, partial [Lachnospiraceae bacterium]|nr:ABC-2 transporter permease [Lachnospiraceae bacterium]